MSSKKIVLTVDDVAVNLATIRGILSSEYDVRVAKSGELALYILGSVEVDLILLDIEMPGMSGFDFLDVLQDLPNVVDTPVIIVTSHATSNFISKASAAGAVDYIAKPINAHVLRDKVHKALSTDNKG